MSHIRTFTCDVCKGEGGYMEHVEDDQLYYSYWRPCSCCSATGFIDDIPFSPRGTPQPDESGVFYSRGMGDL